MNYLLHSLAILLRCLALACALGSVSLMLGSLFSRGTYSFAGLAVVFALCVVPLWQVGNAINNMRVQRVRQRLKLLLHSSGKSVDRE